jgi:hypothetical protein
MPLARTGLTPDKSAYRHLAFCPLSGMARPPHHTRRRKGDSTYVGNRRQAKIAVAKNDTFLPAVVASRREVSVNRQQLSI